ncbi:hypothetical protein [Bacillus sp. FDAARGOS_1420]|uniref:hypothetical protein n=1 Tax=Bacillus sp. FDAARGOS_1420 TaxID=2856338 RepID=UPI001C5A7851|nr:hypothetical protein [Bacillus sp. FDAARGOS_1420]MBW3492417.1 hypothetical protein [Bacillus sp. FDAARGOS_1420]
MGYAKMLIKTLAIATSIPLGYVVYAYFTNYVPKQGMVDNIVCGLLIIFLLLVPILMWKNADKL